MTAPSCTLCPRRCGVPRGEGFCGMPLEARVASVCVHRGEEPPLNPIVNIFFAGCNLQCIYCQNWQISEPLVRPASSPSDPRPLSLEARGVDSIADEICSLLPSPLGRGAGAEALLGFVTAAHYIHLVRPVVEAIHARGLQPVVVYNSSGYESVEALRTLEGVVDVYLPDFKYMDTSLADAYSHAPDYPEVAAAAIREMRRQVGPTLKVGDDGLAYRGLLVRHLVLPGALENTALCLQWLADELPPTMSLSLMAQYFPPRPGLPAPLDRTLTADEYDRALALADRLGFLNLYTQQLDAQSNYRPDFTNENPFGK